MSLYSLSVIAINNQPTPVIYTGGQYYAIAEHLPGLLTDSESGLLPLLSDWNTSHAALEELARTLSSSGHGHKPAASPQTSEFCRLISYPPRMMCIGFNYDEHITIDSKITGFDKSAADPLFFLKQRGALVGAGQTIPYPKQVKKLDWEVELVVIFGRGGKDITAENAMDHVAGYAIGLDLSARDWQLNERSMRKWDLFCGKAFDNSGPVGPWFVPAEYISTDDLKLKLWVNDELKQDSSTRHMVWPIPELIEEVTRHMAIESGDMLFTGTPAGVGFASDTFLKPGDVIRASIDGLGELVTPIAQTAT
jgi:2,4-diketo-3-deoxy-L-fuconate hydrolase